MVVEADVYDCVTSAVAAGPYLDANCTDIMDTSGWGDDDDWNGSDNSSDISWSDNNGDDGNDGSSYMSCHTVPLLSTDGGHPPPQV